jgi:hypothetical protein
MKTYVLMVSKHFMKGHPRAGQPTNFLHKIVAIPLLLGKPSAFKPKIHTIRSNYDYWAHVAEEVNAGRGILSLRQWTGSPYNYQRDGSKQKEFMRLAKMGVQRVRIEIKGERDGLRWPVVFFDGDKEMLPDQWPQLTRNDGFEWEHDLLNWFKWEPMDGAIVHFTDFRY